MRKMTFRFLTVFLVAAASIMAVIAYYSITEESGSSAPIDGLYTIISVSDVTSPSDVTTTAEQTTTAAAPATAAATGRPAKKTNTTAAYVAPVTTTPPTTPAPTTTAALSTAQQLDKMFADLNAYRTSNGVAALSRVTSGPLYTAASIRLDETSVLWSHQRPNGQGGLTVFEEVGLSPYSRGENLAYGSLGSVYNMWLASSSHRANILNSGFTRSALVCKVVNGRRYWVQLFMS